MKYSRRFASLIARLVLVATAILMPRGSEAAPAAPNDFYLPWKTFSIQDNLDPSFTTSIAYDNLGRLHVSYVVNHELRYAVLAGSVWDKQVVAPGIEVSGQTLALDAAGRPHIAYCASAQAGTPASYVGYASLNSSGWTKEVVAVSASGRPSLAIDSNGTPHISYGAVPVLNYAIRSSTGWASQPVDTEVYGYMRYALGVEDSGVPHIAYYDMGPAYGGVLMHAVLRGSVWAKEVVDEYPSISDGGPEFGVPTAVELDKAETPHILYYDGPKKRFKYAVLQNSNWISQTVQSSFPVDGSMHAAMTLDDAGQPHISFADQYRQHLYYLTPQSTNWQAELIDDTAMRTTGWSIGSAITMNSAGTMAVSYFNWDAMQLKWALRLHVTDQVFLPMVTKL